MVKIIQCRLLSITKLTEPIGISGVLVLNVSGAWRRGL